MISLETAIKKNSNINLSVAYFSKKDKDDFVFDGVSYYPMYEDPGPKNKLSRQVFKLKKRFKNKELCIQRMLDIVKSVKPDIVHIHGTEERFGLLASYIHDIPIVFSIQGLIAPISEKFYAGMPKTDCQKIDGLYRRIRRGSVYDQYLKFIKNGEREIEYLKNAKYIIGRTKWDENITYLENPQRKYFVVNEIMREPFYAAKWKKKEYRDKIHIVSTISPGVFKGYETVLKTARLLTTFSPQDYEWTIIGGAEGFEHYLNICIKITGINLKDVNLNFIGRKNAEEMVKIISGADMYVHVSHIENSPNCVCEAMMLGMPIICTFVGGSPSILKDGEEGILVQEGDPYGIAGAIVKLFGNFEAAKKFGAAARSTALERHNPQNVVTELMQAYQTIAKDY